MKIIDKKINGTRRRVAQAIADRDVAFVQDLARRQAEAGAAWLDVAAGPVRAARPTTWSGWCKLFRRWWRRRCASTPQTPRRYAPPSRP